MSYKYLDTTGLAYFWNKIKEKIAGVTRNDLANVFTKEYSGLYGSSNDADGASFYFASVRPTTFYDVWRVRYKVYASVPNQNNYRQFSEVEFVGNQNNISFASFNRIADTNYTSYLYHNLYRLNATGYNAGYKHWLGVGLRGSTNPTSGNFPRTIKIEILETENCVVEMLNATKKRAELDGQGTTNFAGVSEINGRDNGLQETGDNNTIHQLRHNNGNYTAYTNLYRYQLCFSKDELNLLPANSVNNSTATTKTLTTEAFNPFGQILYYSSTTTVNAAGAIAGSALYQQVNMDLRYSFNTGTTLTNNKDVYLVCDPQTNGLVKLASTPITQVLPTTADGKVYIYLGRASSTANIELHPEHPVYEFKSGKLRFWSNITKTSELTNDNNFNYSIQADAGTIDDLAAFTSGKPGITGSISLTKKSSGVGSEIPGGWYNFYFSPHRSGVGTDNPSHGNIILVPMTFSGLSWILRRSASTNTITEVKAISNARKVSDLTNDTGFITNASTIFESRLTWGNSSISSDVSAIDSAIEPLIRWQ